MSNPIVTLPNFVKAQTDTEEVGVYVWIEDNAGKSDKVYLSRDAVLALAKMVEKH